MKRNEKGEQLNRSYLVRFWRYQTTMEWRATIQNVRSKEQRHFLDLKAFLAWLESELESVLLDDELVDDEEDMAEQ